MAAETFHNLIQGQSALFQEKEQKRREIMAIFKEFIRTLIADIHSLRR